MSKDIKPGSELANDEARKAAPSAAWFVDQYWRTTGDDWAIPDYVMVAFGRKMYAEGIRQAREVVAGAGGGYDFGLPGHSVGLATALAAIDALGEDDRG